MLGYVAANPAAFGGSSSLRGQRAVSVESRATRSGRGGWSSSAFWGEKPNGMNNFGSVSTPSRDYEVICHLPLGTLEHHHDEERVTVPEAFSDVGHRFSRIPSKRVGCVSSSDFPIDTAARCCRCE